MEENKKTIELTYGQHDIIFFSLLSRLDVLRERIDNNKQIIKYLEGQGLQVDPIHKGIIEKSEKEIIEVEKLLKIWRENY